ncbi:5-carboxymethyl-2-hydroxymuconate Delta-isomerase [Muricauda sp. NFXS6]|uniref:5-carboxymethyl-2-hydroxymuconate Delta-isomerase n=1 Tax=Allomuricauda sp. NFXS6 TaxID=2819094 RepID=UPI0032DFF2F6
MPHFIIECNQEITEKIKPEELLQTVYHAADATGLFEKSDIKVRIKAYEQYLNGGIKKDFIHVFGNILYGRTDEQKTMLSRKIVEQLNHLSPNTDIVSMNIRDFDKASYCNKNMIA